LRRFFPVDFVQRMAIISIDSSENIQCAMNMVLAARELGPGSVQVGAFNELEVPGPTGNLRLVAIIPSVFRPGRRRAFTKDEAAVAVG
jgi:hypothetical protein